MSNSPTERLAQLAPHEKRALLAQLARQQQPKPRTAPLTLAQERILALCALEPDSAGYNISTAYRLQGPLDPAALERALNQIIQRHAVLRTTFSSVDGQPAQLIAHTRPLVLARHDLRGLPEDAQTAQLREQLLRQGKQPFDLAHDLLLRASLFQLDTHDQVLALTTHRLVFDGQCWPVLIAELIAGTSAAQPPLPDLPLSYADYAAWQREWLRSGALEQQQHYWQNQLSGRLRLLNLPTDHPRGPHQARSALHSFTLPAQVSEALRTLSQQEGVSLFVTLLAAFQVLLFRYTTQEDFLIFTSVAGRNRPELRPLIGLFANILALRSDLAGDPSFRTLLGRAREASANAFAHQDLPFEQILEQVQIERDQPYAGIFQAMLIFWPEPLPPLEWPGMQLSPLDIDTKSADFDLQLHIINTRPAMSGTLRYRADLFERASIARLLERFAALLADIVIAPHWPISELTRSKVVAPQGPITGPAPILPSQWSYLRTPTHWVNMIELVELEQRPDRQLFEQAVQHLLEHHDALRTRFTNQDGQWRQWLPAPGGPLPLRVIDLCDQPASEHQTAMAAALSALQSQLGPHTDTLFLLVLFDRGPELPAYLVFNVHHVIFDNASLPLLLEDLHSAYHQLAGGEPVRLPAKTSSVQVWGERLAAYTASPAFGTLLSGELAHFQQPCAPLPIDKPEGRTQNTLASTAHVYTSLPAHETNTLLREFPKVHRVWLRDILLTALTYAVTRWSGTPRAVLQIVDAGRNLDFVGMDDIDLSRTAGCLFLPGILVLEQSASDDLLDWLQAVRAQLQRFPSYGIAVGMAQQIEGYPAARQLPPAELRLNYLGQPVTPELVGWMPRTSSALEDLVVNRRHGAIDRNPVLLNCTALIYEGQLTMNWEYSEHIHQRSTIEQLADSVIAALHTLAERHGQLQAVLEAQAAKRVYVAPSTPAEELLAGIWSQLLGHSQVGIHDNFFELGGDSIIGLRIIARANQMGVPITPKQLFEHQTIAKLAAAAGATGDTALAARQAQQGPALGVLPLTPLQQFFFALPLENPHYSNIALLQEIDLVPDMGLLQQALDLLLQHHDMLRVRFAQQATGWLAQLLPPDADLPKVRWIDLSATPATARSAAIEATVQELHRQIHLTDGPLLHVAYLNLGAGVPGRLLLLFHHLLIDTVSMQIVLEDLLAAYMQIPQGQAVQLPPKSTSVQQWAERLVQYAQSAALRAELEHWLALPWESVQPLPVDYPNGRAGNTQGSLQGVEVFLSAEETGALIQQVHRMEQAQMIDVILAALGQAFAPWQEGRPLLIEMLGHGRHPLFDDVDLSRTVGWFGDYVPVFVPAGPVAESLRAVAAQRRSMPERGSGYFVLRYLCDDPAVAARMRQLPHAEVMLNYRGHMAPPEDNNGMLRPAAESVQPEIDPQNHRLDTFWCQGEIVENRLRMGFAYSAAMYQHETVVALAQRFLAGLRAVIGA